MKSRANGAPIGKEPAMAKGVCGRLCHWGPLGAIGKLTKCEIILRKTYCQISLLEDREAGERDEMVDRTTALLEGCVTVSERTSSCC